MENIWYSNKSHKTTRESSLSNQPSSVPQRHPSETINMHPFHDSDFNRQLPQISPRISQLDSFLNQGLKAKKSKSNATDANLFFGKSNETTPKEAQLRIRGKSNIIQTQEGSLLFSIYEQRQEQEREKQLKQAKKYLCFIISLGALNYSISLKITDIESLSTKLNALRKRKDNRIKVGFCDHVLRNTCAEAEGSSETEVPHWTES